MTIGRFGEEGLINHGNWSAMGLRATASNDIECRELRVAKADCLIAPMNIIQVLFNADPLARTRQTAGGALGITGIWLGAAQAAFDFTIDYVKNRFGYLAAGTLVPGGGEYRADEAWAQVGIGNMDHWLGTGRVLLYDIIERLDSYTDEATLARDLMRTTFHLRRMTEEVAMGSMRVCGAHAYVTARPLERIFRDLIGGAVMAWKTDQLQQSLGLGALGRPILFTGPAGS
jgi:alkylation response protein AidB-like acyl-CoA dehydrogenase